MFGKKTRDNQTVFTGQEPLLEEVGGHEDEAVVVARLQRKKRIKFFSWGIVCLFLCLFVLSRLIPKATPSQVVVEPPVPTPTLAPTDMSLTARLKRARLEVKAVDFNQADTSFPFIDQKIYLDDPTDILQQLEKGR